MDKEFLKFIEFEGSGRPHRGDGMIEAFRLLVCCPDAIVQPDKETDRRLLSALSVAQAGSGQA